MRKGILLMCVTILVAAGCVFGCFIGLDYINEQYRPKTIELTIEHLWEEDNEYYFADSNGSVYELGNYRDVSDKIMYSEMPKHRFERLNVGSRYEIKYISGIDYWISISEKEIE